MLYLQDLNAIYGIIKAALIFYWIFFGNINTIGLNINPYDPCVENKVVNINQMTVMWHVNDIKVIQKSKKIITSMAKWLKKIYERLFEDGSSKMNISRGKIHKYLCMILDFSAPG